MVPFLSIIIPVYNVEGFLSRCLDSIIEQNCAKIEIILIDDGSHDNSGEICDQYTKAHDFIHVYHKENGGVSSARNLGIEKSQGKWIWFIDSDDTIEPNALENIFNGINNADENVCAIHFGLQKVENVVTSKYIPQRGREYASTYIKGILNYSAETGPVTYIINKELLGLVRFNEKLKIGEDTYFDLNFLFKNADREVVAYPQIIYNYLLNPESATRIKNLRFIEQYTNLTLMVGDFLQDNGLYSDHQTEYEYFSLMNYVQVENRLFGQSVNYKYFQKNVGIVLNKLHDLSKSMALEKMQRSRRIQVKIGRYGSLVLYMYLKVLNYLIRKRR